jgi:E3 ubiquitin-protein ligase synoviolin
MLYLDIIIGISLLTSDFFKLIAFSIFFALIMHYYGLPIHIIREVYITIKQFVSKIQDLLKYREATKDMDSRYPAATVDEIAVTDGICIVCREDMTATQADDGL